MSDFISPFWAIYVAGLTIIGIVACLVLLWVTSKKKVKVSQDNTTGHVWDGDLREMNNPLPRWWVGLFLITIIFSAYYLVVYPGLGNYAGSRRWTQEKQYNAEVDRINQQLDAVYARFQGMTPQQLTQDAQAMMIGERLFMNSCAQCHGSDAKGSIGFPNLTDGDWLGQSTPEAIEATIINGRTGVMAPIAAAVGDTEDVRNVANYVLSLSGLPHDTAKAMLGKDKFAMVCAACHGPDGKGNKDLGAPNLTDDIWLHDVADEQGIMGQVIMGKVNIMPPQGKLLTPAQIKVLAAYVWGLSPH